MLPSIQFLIIQCNPTSCSWLKTTVKALITDSLKGRQPLYSEQNSCACPQLLYL